MKFYNKVKLVFCIRADPLLMFPAAIFFILTSEFSNQTQKTFQMLALGLRHKNI